LRERVKRIQNYDHSKSDEDIYIRDEMQEVRPEDYMSAESSERSEEEEDTVVGTYNFFPRPLLTSKILASRNWPEEGGRVLQRERALGYCAHGARVREVRLEAG